MELISGCVVRASRTEIFGHPDGHLAKDHRSPSKDPKDLTSSRLQSELYRKWHKLDNAAAKTSVGSVSGASSLLVYVKS